MKSLTFKTVTILFLLIFTGVYAQWQADVRLTNDPAGSYTSLNNAKCIAASGDTVHVVWYDTRDGNHEIYYKRSTNAGANWGTDQRRTNNAAHSWNPSVTVSGSVVHIVWQDMILGDWEIYYNRSTNAGTNWGQINRLCYNTAASENPSVSVSGSVVHVVWMDSRDGNWEIYYNRSTDAGVSWETDKRLTNNSADSYLPSVSVSGSVVHAVWYDDRDGNWEIYYKRSTNAGVNWSTDTRLTNNTALSGNPSIAVTGSIVHVVWRDDRDGNREIYYKRSIDGGVSWSPDIRMTNNTAWSDNPSVAVSGSAVHVVWEDTRDGNDEIYYKRSTNAGVNWSTDTRLTNNTAWSNYPSVAVSGTAVHVVWRDLRDGNYEIYYKRNPTGNPTGMKNISSEIPSSYSLDQNYPNPFNPTTKIRFELPRTSFVTLKVFDVLGREILTLVNEELQAGVYEVDFPELSDGRNYPSGVYYYRMTAGEYTDTKKMIITK